MGTRDVRVVNHSIGSLEAFDLQSGKWPIYKSRLDQYFIAQDVTEADKKKAILLCSVGAEVCDLIWDLFSPADPTTATYDAICAKLQGHLVPAKVEIAERFKFYQRKQKEDETVKDFEGALRNLAKDCICIWRFSEVGTSRRFRHRTPRPGHPDKAASRKNLDVG